VTIELDIRDGVAVLAFNRPDAGNGINLEFGTDLRDASAKVAADASVRALLIRGNGKNFCVGGDLKHFASLGDGITPALRELADLLHESVLNIHGLTVPVVTAVQGNAAGAGFSLSLLGDVCVAARSAKFRMAYTAIGFTPDGGSSWMLPRLVGPRVAADLSLTNRTLDAEEAQRLGLVSRIVDDDALVPDSEALVQQLTDGPTGAFGYTKRLLAESPGATFEAQLDAESISISTRAGEPEGQEGLAAFLEKRPPKFR
jgi:2-(1,2-epoxy-1,2-dihydrophenyl)acetyl-CoA isomerase